MSASRIATENDGLLLFCLNDHLPPRALPETRYLPLFSPEGRLISNPPNIGLSKLQSKRSQSRIPRPSETEIEIFFKRWTELTPRATSRIVALRQIFHTAAGAATTLAEWHGALMMTFFCTCKVRLLFTSKLREVMPTEFHHVLFHFPENFWGHCANCGYRLIRWDQQDNIIPCASCGNTEQLEPLPDVIARQVIINILKPWGRICGRQKPYQSQADEISAGLGMPVPVRFRVPGPSRLMLPNGRFIDRFNAFQALAESPQPLSPPTLHDTPWELVLETLQSGKYVPSKSGSAE
jgi:hypothetical protein